MPTGWIDWPWYRLDAWVANIPRVQAEIQHLQSTVDPHTLKGIENATLLRTNDKEAVDKLIGQIRMEMKIQSLPKSFG